MSSPINKKIISLDEIVKKVEEFQARDKTVVQSHGVFDIIHPGIIQHLNEAKRMGDILIVTVIRDKDVRRGPGRPVFQEALRAGNVANLESVDFVCIVDDETPFECAILIKPEIFAKGKAYKDRDRKIHDKIFEEERELYFGKSKILETSGFSFSSSMIINNFLDIYPEETKHFLRTFSRRYSFNEIVDNINSLKDLNILLIGDGIVDEYHYCVPMGKSGKAQLVVNKYITHELFAGGVFAIANHLAGICDNVKLVTLLGNEDSREEFIVNNIKPNIKTRFFYRGDGPTVIKKRYVDSYKNQKLFEINYLNDQYVSGDLETEIIEFLISEAALYDLILVSDFGHGFISDNIIKIIEKSAKIFAVNTQTNSANTGFNMVTKYHRPNFVCLDEKEARLSMQSRFEDTTIVAERLLRKIGAESIIITLGKKGALSVNKQGEVFTAPVFSSKVVDTVGAGDAFFSFTAPCFAKGMPSDLITFIGNAVGAIAVQVVCNKKAVEKLELFELINSLLKND